MWHREGRKMATRQYRSAFSFDDVAQKTTLARSAHQNNSERTSKPLEEQCDEFVSLVSVRFQGVKTIDVIERNRPPKNSVAFEPGDLEVDFVLFFSMFWGRQKGVFAPAGALHRFTRFGIFQRTTTIVYLCFVLVRWKMPNSWCAAYLCANIRTGSPVSAFSRALPQKKICFLC